ncbi:hypothetical protein T02_8119 [Trichinella nativa]|uniref:Uncharacterized protein n=1 Tax=Trichinella nativa TaxID=6335 RepID=A0A0V1KRM4_9BILA|nr:hypothetical protein T02_8119 [Trichinella nativa]
MAWPQPRSRCWAARHGMGRALSSPSSRPSWLFPEFASQLSEQTSRRSSFPGRSEQPDFSPPSPAHVLSNGQVATAPHSADASTIRKQYRPRLPLQGLSAGGDLPKRLRYHGDHRPSV